MIRPWVIAALAALVVGRFVFHVLFLPVFEGPDEPFHLGRIVAFREVSFWRALRGEPLAPAIVSAAAAHSCAPDLHRAFGCPLFDGSGATFNILQRVTLAPATRRVENYENQQPPLYYLVAGITDRLISPPSGGPPDQVERDLLVFRLLSVALVCGALVWPFRVVFNAWSYELRVAALMALLLPGAAEALARCSNDSALFLWCAMVTLALRKQARGSLVLTLLVVGPLIKLTAFPVVAAGVVWLWERRRRRLAVVAGLGSLLVLPVQLLWGWGGSGSYDLSRALLDPGGSSAAMLRGLIRSVYTVVKTVFWIGGWSFFRAPRPLVLGWFLLLAIVLISLRLRRDRRRVIPHAVGFLTLGAGVLLLAVANRKVFGDWGGLGGWYVWSWLPWLMMAAAEAFQISRGTGRKLLAAEATFVVVANLLYFAAASRVYG